MKAYILIMLIIGLVNAISTTEISLKKETDAQDRGATAIAGLLIIIAWIVAIAFMTKIL